MKHRVLVMGATGLLGRTLIEVLRQQANFEVYAGRQTEPLSNEQISGIQWVSGISSYSLSTTAEQLERVKPQTIINCTGITGHASTEQLAPALISVYAQLPQFVAAWAYERGIRFIHLSSDGVFSGRAGPYMPNDPVDAADAYGLIKAAGEPRLPNCLVLRTSFIGHAQQGTQRLLDWAIAQKQAISGYRNYVFSALTTLELSHLLTDRILPMPELAGIHHVPGRTVSKYELLQCIAQVYELNVAVQPVDLAAGINRVLNAEFLSSLLGYQPPDWETMLRELQAMRPHIQPSFAQPSGL
jgi:dTDP-4-dehydrorhamnose reductase